MNILLLMKIYLLFLLCWEYLVEHMLTTFIGQLRRCRFIVFFNYFILFFFLSYIIIFFFITFHLTCYFVCIPVQGKFPEEKKDTHGNCNA